MLKATSKVDRDAIKAYVADKAVYGTFKYLTIKEYENCELDGCVKYEVYWLGISNLSMQNFYLDAKTHEIVHVTSYV